MQKQNNLQEAEMLIGKAIDLQNSQGDQKEVEALFLKAIAIAEEFPVPYYNLGLLYKYQKKWEKSLEYNQKAIELNPNSEAALWNLGIAATALKKWRIARKAWKMFGLDVAEGQEELRMNLGLTPINLTDNKELNEVVWCNRIDPARAIIEFNIPLPDSGYRWRDIIAHDGAPRGKRFIDKQEFVVFDALDLFARSEYRTYSVDLHIPSKTDFDELTKIIDENDLKLEDWSKMRLFCEECHKKGVQCEVHSKTDHWLSERNFGLAAKTMKSLEDVLKKWTSGNPSRTFSNIKLLN